MAYKKYDKFLADKQNKKDARKEKINSNQVFKVVKNVLGFLAKQGLKLIKLTFKLTKHGINLLFWAGGEAIKFVAYTLEIAFAKMDDKYRKSDNYNARRIIVGAIVAFLVVGGTVTGLKIKGLSDKNAELRTALETQITTVNAKTGNSDEKIANEAEIEIEAEEEAQNKKEENGKKAHEKEALAKKESDTKKAEEQANVSGSVQNPGFIGEVGITSEIGSVDPGYMGTTEVRHQDDKGQVVVEKVDEYGIGQFTTSPKKRYVGQFMQYLKEKDQDFFNEYFKDVDEPGTTTFTTGWYSASKYEAEKFKELQFNYVFEKYVAPTVVAVKDKFGIDLMSTKAYQEFAYSTANQYDVKGTLLLFEKANINSEMSEKDVIEAVQNEKINSLGKYTYTDKWSYNEAWRNGIKVRAEKEKTALLGMVQQ